VGDEPAWLDDHEQRAWRAYTKLRSQLDARLSRQLQRDAGISAADYSVLVHLSEAPDRRLRLFELGGALQWEKSRLSHHLTRMERRGLVERSECPSDARGMFVELTADGLIAIEAAAPEHVAAVRRHFVDVLTEEQLDQFAAVAEAVITRLADDLHNAPPCP
jgi:DNA-binding MarR family transcriptional regulator